jgi:uncharacterized protein (DUF486 family)
MPYIAIGILLNSALYLTAVFVAGIAMANRGAVLFAIASFGVTYLSYMAQLIHTPFGMRFDYVLQGTLVGVSIALGLVAGLLLLRHGG